MSDQVGRPLENRCKFCGEEVVFRRVWNVFQYRWECQNPDGTPHRCLGGDS